MSAHEAGQRPETAKGNEENQTDTIQRLDALERIILRQQEEINQQANTITLLKIGQHNLHTRVGVIEGRDARYGCDGK